MSIDRSAEVAAEMLIARLDLSDPATLVLEWFDEDADERVVLLTLTDVDDWDAVNVDNLHLAKDFVRARIIDRPGLEDVLNRTETAVLEGHRWKVDRGDPPFGATRIWTLRLNRIEKVTT